jgi:acyl-coenzyme A thioesterase PaaI-like protein
MTPDPDDRFAHHTAPPPEHDGAQNLDLAVRIFERFEAGGTDFMRDMHLRIEHAEPGLVRFTVPVAPGLTHSGGVLSGQAIMACMDTGMVFVMMSLNDAENTDFTTVELKTAFERGVPADVGEVTFEAWATKPGRTLVFGQIDLFLPDGRRAATATTTYMWL